MACSFFLWFDLPSDWSCVHGCRICKVKLKFLPHFHYPISNQSVHGFWFRTVKQIFSPTRARNLGVWFDSQLNFNSHIRKTCSLSFGTLYKIRRIRKYLTFKSAQTLVLALVIGRLDYCNSLLYGLPASYVNMLQRVQNAGARLISNTPRFGHISPVMKDLHWLPVKYRIMFKIVVFTFKAIHGSAPTYISQLIRLKPKSTYMLRSNKKDFLLDQPRKMKKTTGDRAFLAAAPTLWNALPDDLRTLDI